MLYKACIFIILLLLSPACTHKQSHKYSYHSKYSTKITDNNSSNILAALGVVSGLSIIAMLLPNKSKNTYNSSQSCCSNIRGYYRKNGTYVRAHTRCRC